VKNSNTPDALTPYGAHIYYARQAYLDRGVPGRYGAFRPTEVQAAPGDILVRSRNGQGSFSDIQKSGPMVTTHGDIVTAVGQSELLAVGGNLDNTVKERRIPHLGGVVTDPEVFAVLKLQPGARIAGREPREEVPAAYLMRSGALIRGLHPSLQGAALAFIQRAYLAGVPVVVASGKRSLKEQAALYAQGRTTPGAIVTPVRPGESSHETGLAFDVAPIEPEASGLGKVIWPWPDDPGLWARLGSIGEGLGLVWGGRFTDAHGDPRPDRPHFAHPRTRKTAGLLV
jgi:hypothetical protein